MRESTKCDIALGVVTICFIGLITFIVFRDQFQNPGACVPGVDNREVGTKIDMPEIENF